MPFTTSGQETEWALVLQPRSPHGAHFISIYCKRSNPGQSFDSWYYLLSVKLHNYSHLDDPDSIHTRVLEPGSSRNQNSQGIQQDVLT